MGKIKKLLQYVTRKRLRVFTKMMQLISASATLYNSRPCMTTQRRHGCTMIMPNNSK
jgi:hypothetical protein